MSGLASAERSDTLQLNHLDLQTHDVQALAAFFVDHFDFIRRTNDRSPAIAVLADEAGFTLVLQRHDAPVYPDGFHIGFIHAAVAPVYPDGFHIGFIHAAVAPVVAHRERLVAAGREPSPIDVNNRGTRFYLRGPGDLLIEVSTS